MPQMCQGLPDVTDHSETAASFHVAFMLQPTGPLLRNAPDIHLTVPIVDAPNEAEVYNASPRPTSYSHSPTVVQATTWAHDRSQLAVTFPLFSCVLLVLFSPLLLLFLLVCPIPSLPPFNATTSDIFLLLNLSLLQVHSAGVALQTWSDLGRFAYIVLFHFLPSFVFHHASF
jgi:hypothetical protein